MAELTDDSIKQALVLMRHKMKRDTWIRNVMKIYPEKTREETEALHDKIFPKYSYESIHPDCKRTKLCQETEGFKGTEHEGVDVCEDGCVWARGVRHE